jgi:hypothetical protein
MILASTKPPLSPLLCFDLRIEGDVRQQSVPDAMKESHELLSSSPVHNNLSNFTCGAQSWTTCCHHTGTQAASMEPPMVAKIFHHTCC